MLRFKALSNDLRLSGRLTKLGKKDLVLIAGTRNAEFMGYKDIRQNPQDKAGTNKANSAIGLNQFQAGKR